MYRIPAGSTYIPNTGGPSNHVIMQCQVRRKKAKKGSKGGEWDDLSSEAAPGGVGMAGQRVLVHWEGAGRWVLGKKRCVDPSIG